MLKLNRLEISGFKTFVEPVSVDFSDGITAIVGPNGCGKSNLSDAITWVLGEQSAKSLRGSKMQDVIFNGSEKRQPLGMAEVTLELVGDPSFAAAVEGKVRIGRRVFRSGESQYRLNGKVTRLKEIKDLLMDTGLGIRAYSVIEQGKIGMILSGKPQERRKLLEEAAGVTRYKARKRVAEVKLEEATANLLRLDDIISEVERALRSLKRQANAARRYQERETEHRELLRQVLQGRWGLLRTRLTDLETDLGERTREDASLTADLSRDEAALAEGRELLDQLASTLAATHQRSAEVAATIEGRQEFLRGARRNHQELGERLTRGKQQTEDRVRRSDEYQHALSSLDQRTLQLIGERDEAARLVAEDDARIAAAEQAVRQAEARVESLRREMMSSLAKVNDTRQRLQQEQTQIERRSFRRRYLDEERARLDKQLGEARGILDTIARKVAENESGLEEREQRRQQLASDLDGLLRREAELAEERRELEARLAGQRQRRRMLVELSEEHSRKRRSLEEALSGIGLPQPRFLAEQARSVEGWERGIDHFLGELADAVMLDAEQPAVQLAQALSAAGASGVFLSPIAADATDAAWLAALDLEDPAITYSLAEALDLPEELGRALPPAFLVHELEDAQRLAMAHPGVAFISRDRLWAVGGCLRVQGEQATPGVLARQNELESLEEEIPNAERTLADTATALQNMVGERTRLAQEINRVDEEVSALRREIAVAQARRQDAATRCGKVEQQRQTVVQEQDEIDDFLKGATAEKQGLSDRLAAAEEQHQELSSSFDRAGSEGEAAKEEREQLRTAGAGRRGRLELLEERLESQNQEAARVRRQIEEAQEAMTTWRQEEEALERRRRELELSVERAEEELSIALETRAGSEEAVLAEQARLDLKREELRQVEERVAATREGRDQIRQRLEGLRVDRAALVQDSEHLSRSYREQLQLALPGTLSDDEQEALRLAREEEERQAAEAEAARAAAEQELLEGEIEVLAAEEPDDESAQDPLANTDDVDGDPEAENDNSPVQRRLLLEDELLPAVDQHQLVQLEADLARVKEALDRLGPVNVLAAQEYDEQQERHGFLTTQRVDVADSVRRLRQTIEEINSASSQLFLETFHQVNKTFGETFTRLFRGGEAHMGLLDEEDPLETGIEITARPPGKRPQSIMLLSGGEKALTAIALLFALFQSRPSPFCILDEVDAPLDDANVLRFVDQLQEMAKGTQFLVVTHNKLTMEVAGTLYGVTMEERGVSKLVSVEMDKVHSEPALATA